MSKTVRGEISLFTEKLHGFLKSPQLFSSPVEELSDEEVLALFLLLKKLDEDVIQKRMGQARTFLLELTEDSGEKVIDEETGNESFQMTLSDDCKVVHQVRHAKAPNDDKIRDLLEKKKISKHLVFDEIKVFALNPSKLENLVSVGKLTKEEVAACIPPPTPALLTYPKPMTKKALSDLVNLANLPMMEGVIQTSAQKRKEGKKEGKKKKEPEVEVVNIPKKSAG